ncbi:MAG: ATP-binding protein [Methanomicrobiaceae archaeon]|uniref:Mind superfamily p-loop atpase containing an inserted ferredoxin domain n=1 Tax=hydrocarbon metagenome TaxID=938273 RepID=A0A0W8FDA3_9ZZZZ|nr:ATP-binding protein [Methanomicrobiaceae archaeon]MDD5419553.1 ATP-binding protein [Methanomicrobiaceae archaeon]
MIRIAVISGKGGTGKTMLTAGLADIISLPLALADCDVDASNLELLLAPTLIREEAFFGMPAAQIDPERCISCGICRDYCRFSAVVLQDGEFRIDPVRCEGCAVCTAVCPEDAVSMQPRRTGDIYYSETERGHLSHARLLPGAGNSGLLVNEVKQRILQSDGDCAVLLVDGPPGIGCPLTSTLSGMDAAIVVTEPSVSGLHDFKRVVSVCRQMRVRIFAVINRRDLDPDMAEAIGEYCRSESIPLLGEIPFDETVIETVRNGEPVTRHRCPATEAIHRIWHSLQQELEILP